MSPTKADFKAVLSQARDLVKVELDKTEQVIMQVAKNAPAGISDRLVTLFSRKGKRIRSTLLCLLANCGTQKPDIDRVAHACAAVELLHLASLVHDDIIDGTDVRRGQKTAHREWGTQVAVLIGDYVLSQSMRCVIDEEARNIPVIISDAADKLIIGEIMELDHCGDMGLSRKAYNEIIDGKTAALIDAAARIGGILAGFDQPMVDECAKMGTHFGIAFQEMEGFIAKASAEGIPEKIQDRLFAKKSFAKAKAEAQEHLEQALAIADKFPKSNFTEEITAMFASMSERGN